MLRTLRLHFEGRCEDLLGEPMDNTTVVAEKPTGRVKQGKKGRLAFTSRRPSVKVEVIRVLHKNETTTSVISKGLVALSCAMSALNNCQSSKDLKADGYSLSNEIATIITTVVDIMATVRDKSKPRIIRPYHAYATNTAVAAWFTARILLVDFHIFNVPKLNEVLTSIFCAYVYFSLAVLVTPNHQVVALVDAIETVVADSTRYTQPLSVDSATNKAKEIFLKLSKLPRSSPSFPSNQQPSLSGPRPPKQHATFRSPLSPGKLARIARGLAVEKISPYPNQDIITQAAWELATGLYRNSDCRHSKCDGRPVCWCSLHTVSSTELFLDYHETKLLPGI